MARLTKKNKALREAIEPGKTYEIVPAIELLKNFSSKKFNETIDIAINLGIDPRKSDQMVRTATNLPNGTGKTVRVAVFAQGDNAAKAANAGADIVGFDDLAQTIKSGKIEFEVLIATPDSMRLVGQLGQILGPKGLMPNPKVGTVTTNIEAAVRDAKAGQVRYKTDKNGIIHCGIGKISFSLEEIVQNVAALIADVRKAKPASSKGTYLKAITLSTTMGPGLSIDINSINV